MRPPAAELGFIERYLTVWMLGCIAAGIGLGQPVPGLAAAFARLEVARVNLPVGLLIRIMIIPMLVKVDFGRPARGAQARARHRREACGQLGDQALFDGAARLDIRPAPVC